MGEQVRAQIRDHPLAERHDEIVARSGSQREHRDDAEHAEEIDADEAGVRIRKAEVDHPADGDRNDERRGRSDEQGDERGKNPPAVSERIGQNRFQGAERRSRPF